MKRIALLAAAAATMAASVLIARRRRQRGMHAAELAGPDVIIDEVVVHFLYDDEAIKALPW